jgi:hypothetical protein
MSARPVLSISRPLRPSRRQSVEPWPSHEYPASRGRSVCAAARSPATDSPQPRHCRRPARIDKRTDGHDELAQATREVMGRQGHPGPVGRVTWRRGIGIGPREHAIGQWRGVRLTGRKPLWHAPHGLRTSATRGRTQSHGDRTCGIGQRTASHGAGTAGQSDVDAGTSYQASQTDHRTGATSRRTRGAK